MEEEPFVLDVVEAAPTRPEPEPTPPPAAKAPASVPAVILDDASLAPPGRGEGRRGEAGPGKAGLPEKGAARLHERSALDRPLRGAGRRRRRPPPSLAGIAARPRPVARAGFAVPRVALVALATAALAGGALALYRHFPRAGPRHHLGDAAEGGARSDGHHRGQRLRPRRRGQYRPLR
jgi:hypothetical protein